jgi:transcriptional regulator with XRE-family HTH domain
VREPVLWHDYDGRFRSFRLKNVSASGLPPETEIPRRMSDHLKTYLRTFRRRAGLSQADVAMLLGESSRHRVSDYERALAEPSLEAAIACEIVFGEPIAELFAGVYDEVELSVILRTHRLIALVERSDPAPIVEHRLASLRRIAKVRRPGPASTI